jgi:hypothetical protein
VRTQLWTQDVLGVSANSPTDQFGFALATGDFDCDGYGDLAVGHPREIVTGPYDGLVTVIKGSAAGLVSANPLSLAEGFPPLAGDRNVHIKRFGSSVTGGDFDADRCADLVIGMPLRDDGGLSEVGAEIALYGGLLSDGFESGLFDLWSGQTP